MIERMLHIMSRVAKANIILKVWRLQVKPCRRKPFPYNLSSSMKETEAGGRGVEPFVSTDVS